MVDSRRINAVLTTDVSGQEVIIYRGDAYYKRVARTRMANAGKHCVDVFDTLLGTYSTPNQITAPMLMAGTTMAESTAKFYISDIKRMCEGKKTHTIPESRIRRYAWETNSIALLKKFDEVA